jgi:hypothetical protein
MVDLSRPTTAFYAGPSVASESSVSNLAPRNHIESVFPIESSPAFRIAKYLALVVDRRSTKPAGSVCVGKLLGPHIPF